jgi:hypothetical protein
MLLGPQRTGIALGWRPQRSDLNRRGLRAVASVAGSGLAMAVNGPLAHALRGAPGV